MFPIRDHNPSQRLAFVTWGLIALNVAIHLLVMTTVTTDRQTYDLYTTWAMIPAQVTSGTNWTGLLTSAFLHADLMHLGGNMLFLWIFGDNLEDELGHLGFLVFYLLCGVGSAAAQWATEPWSPIPTIGASGAIAGVMGGYLLMFPKAKVDILLFLVFIIRIFPVPAWLMLGLWFGMQLLNGVGVDASQGGVAYWAHAGGFAVGLVLILPAFLRRGGPGFWNRTAGHPDHPDARWGKLSPSSVPAVPRKRPWG